ncbi:MAG: hypothetical protein LH603_10900 [Pseudonocardia sp.]|nr:hypothetical protein [Pseudonocardia sp.]
MNSAISATPEALVEWTANRPTITAKPTGRRLRSHNPRLASPPRAASTAVVTGGR